MKQPQNVMQVFTLLDKSNCRKCGEKTCLAFAGAVFQGKRPITDCPSLDHDRARQFIGKEAASPSIDDQDNSLKVLIDRITRHDLRLAAERTGGFFDGEKLSVKVLGKDFSVDAGGKLYSDIHMIPWVVVPFLEYVLNSEGRPVVGDWVSFRELAGGKERYPLFQKRCEEAMQRIADVYADLFDDITDLFQAKQVESRFDSDISVILPVLPLVPLMICYWKEDEGIGSSLNIFFDRSVDANIGSNAVYTLAAGLTQMFEKLAIRHGCAVKHASI